MRCKINVKGVCSVHHYNKELTLLVGYPFYFGQFQSPAERFSSRVGYRKACDVPKTANKAIMIMNAA